MHYQTEQVDLNKPKKITSDSELHAEIFFVNQI